MRGRLSARMAIACYTGWMLLLVATFYALPDTRPVTWSLLGLSSAAAVVWGIWRNKPRRRMPWLLICASLLLFWAGDLAYTILVNSFGQVNPFPSFADVIYLAMFPVLGAGLIGLAKTGAASHDRSVLLDGLIFTTSAALVWWVFLIAPHAFDRDLTHAERLVSMAYPLFDVLVLATITWLITVSQTSRTVQLLLAGAVGLLIADILYGISQLYGHWTVGGPVDLGWVLFYGAWGVAALHPSMSQLTEPRVVRRRDLSKLRRVVLVASLLIPPAVLAFELARGQSVNAPVIAAFSMVIGMLVMARLIGVVNLFRRKMARAEGLRKASADLVKATDVSSVTWALRRAADRLLPRGTDHRIEVLMNNGMVPELFAAPMQRGGELRYTRSLTPRIAERLGDFELTLSCPLVLEERTMGDPCIGVLLVSSDESALGFLRSPMEMLASQAALAIERIMLSEEIMRRDSEQYFRTLVQNAADVILIINSGCGTIRYASPSAQQVFGTTELVGVKVLQLLAPDDHRQVNDLLELAGGEVSADWTIRRPDGSLVQAEVSCVDLREDPTVNGLVVTIRDVTEQRQLEAELTHRAFHDSLTGLANRVLFQQRMDQAIERAHRMGTRAGVLFLDIDDFKVVNDTLGHSNGDELLRAFSNRLVGVLHPQDIAARLGGDEFAVLIEDASDSCTIEKVATHIVGALSEPFLIDDRLVNGMASIGIATTADAADREELLQQADLALYVAKGSGKHQWRRYEPALHTALMERMELRAALDQALAGGSFELDYQPIVALRSGATAGFEALLRWNHPTRGRLAPDEFIEAAEDSGLIVPIGNWVLNEAVAAIAKLRDLSSSATSPYMSINVSARQFRSPGFVENVRTALALHAVPASSLMLEITESLMLRDDDQVWEDLAELRKLGVRVAIDDFGTGYSSLSYLRHMPLDVLKIDRLFTATINSSAQQAELVAGIVKLAKTLGLQVIAEGIEQIPERNMLTRMGCQYGQGFLYARPFGLDDAAEWVSMERVAA